MSATAVYDSLSKNLLLEIQSPGKRSSSFGKRMTNINFILELSKDKLKYFNSERRIKIYETEKEILYIQYPGKETILEKVMPHDFRPILYFKDKNIEGPLLSFSNIWDILHDKMISLISEDKKYFKILAGLLYNMAFMVDHTFEKNLNTEEIDLKFNEGNLTFEKAKKITLKNIYLYEPPKVIVHKLSKVFGKFGDMSLEAFLYYNDLLGWNEDCKYYCKKTLASGEWISSTGRVNTISTHISVIGSLLGVIKFSQILGRASQMRGVAPINTKEIKILFNEFLNKDNLFI